MFVFVWLESGPVSPDRVSVRWFSSAVSDRVREYLSRFYLFKNRQFPNLFGGQNIAQCTFRVLDAFHFAFMPYGIFFFVASAVQMMVICMESKRMK